MPLPYTAYAALYRVLRNILQQRRDRKYIPTRMNNDSIDSREDVTVSNTNSSGDSQRDSASDEELFENEIEQAYLRALQANKVVERELSHSDTDDSNDGESTETEDVSGEGSHAAIPNSRDSVEHEPARDASQDLLDAVTTDELLSPFDVNSVTATDQSTGSSDDDAQSGRVTERQVIEAALFVGGKPLTTKKLRQLLQADKALDVVNRSIDTLNQQYRSEERPYEIVLAEGGYRLVLRPEFESVRSRVFGLGPKDVKLSQEVLEILALVAYWQPISKQEIEEAGKANAAGIIRQLLRRELIAIERGEDGRNDIRYHTTDRFLSVFGLSTLDELPKAGDFEFK